MKSREISDAARHSESSVGMPGEQKEMFCRDGSVAFLHTESHAHLSMRRRSPMWDKLFYAVAFFAFGLMAGYTFGHLGNKEYQRDIVILELENERLEETNFYLEYRFEDCVKYPI
jgi:hypothetical protein